MAIYKNREVSVVGPNSMANSPDTITIQYRDGTHENVSLGQVRFTEDEKKVLQKGYPSVYDSVETIKQEDLEAVRIGVTPPSDPSFKEAAERQVLQEKQQELIRKNQELAKKEAEKRLSEERKMGMNKLEVHGDHIATNTEAKPVQDQKVKK